MQANSEEMTNTGSGWQVLHRLYMVYDSAASAAS